MAILIADSGSTKTDWAVVADGNIVKRITTFGLNPYHLDGQDMANVIGDQVKGQIDESISDIYFYGSGVTEEKRTTMKEMLSEIFANATNVEAESDMLGAARSMLGRTEGIACILGTGANSCHYDGKAIVANTPAMGYILGDEGSGACIGKHLVNAIYKNPKLSDLKIEFEQTYGITLPTIIERVYRQPRANAFLASLAPFAKEHIGNETLRDMVTCDFANFFTRNLSTYPKGLPVCLIGSIAYHFATQLRQAAKSSGYDIAAIAQSPMDGLINYHFYSK